MKRVREGDAVLNGWYGQVEKTVGRRNALRYTGLGLVSLVLTACGGKKSGNGTTNPEGGKSVRATVTGAAVAAFARGSWDLAIRPKGQVNDEYTRISITGRTWSLDDGDVTGSYELTSRELVVTVNGQSSENVWVGKGLPDTVGDDASFTLRWGADASSDPVDAGSPVDTTPIALPVSWDGRTLKIQAQNGVSISAVRV